MKNIKLLLFLGFIIISTAITTLFKSGYFSDSSADKKRINKEVVIKNSDFGFSIIFPDTPQTQTNIKSDSLTTINYSTFIARKTEEQHVSLTAIKTTGKLLDTNAVLNFNLGLLKTVLSNYNIDFFEKEDTQINGRLAFTYKTIQKNDNIFLAVFSVDNKLFIYEENFGSNNNFEPTALNSLKIE